MRGVKVNSLVLSSGGIDSTVVLALALEKSEVMRTISFDYGQRHRRELQAAAMVAEYYGISHNILDAPVFTGDSVLMDKNAEMPHMTYEELEQSEGVSPTYVPFRNGTFLSIAAGFALQTGLDMIWCGMHAEDARGWAYPDCTPEFIGAMQNAIYVGTYHKVRMLAPLSYAVKREIVSLGSMLGVPFDLTWSCYEGEQEACGRCPTCVSRLWAFKEAGVHDPIAYQTRKVVNG
jgi:7-cyano-7-deazaguanine synthase